MTDPNLSPNGKLCIVEGIAGYWHYHVADARTPWAPLCGGGMTMTTFVRWSSWGFKPGHMPKSYCSKCEARRSEGET